MAQCNNRFTALYYFHKYDWSNYKPIVCSKPKLLSHLRSINSHDWSITLGGRFKVPSENSQPPMKLSMSIQSTADCRRESSANFVPGCSVLLPAFVLAATVP